MVLKYEDYEYTPLVLLWLIIFIRYLKEKEKNKEIKLF